MLIVEKAKKKALEDNLQKFLKNEGYGEIPKHILEGSGPPRVSNIADEKDEASAYRGQIPVIEESPTESRSILTKGVALWMGGIAQILTGPREEIDIVRQLLQDERAKLALMKANAEVGVFGRELTDQEQEAAWEKGHEENLSFLKPAAEVAMLGQALSQEERDEAWGTGPKKKALAKSFSTIVKTKKKVLEDTLSNIRQADHRIEEAASRLQMARSGLDLTARTVDASTPDRSVDASTPDISVDLLTPELSQSYREAADSEAKERFQALFQRAATPLKEEDDKDRLQVEQEAGQLESHNLPRTDSKESSRPPQIASSLTMSEKAEAETEGKDRFQVLLRRASNQTHGLEMIEIYDDRSAMDQVEQESEQLGPLDSVRTGSTNLNASFRNTVASEEGQRIFQSLMTGASAVNDATERPLEQLSEHSPPTVNPEGGDQGSIILAASNFGSNEGEEGIQAEAQQEGILDTEVQTVDSDNGNFAEVMRISTAPGTAGTDEHDPDDAALQQRISMYTDVDVEVIENRPGTTSSVQLRPRTGNSDMSRPHTSLSGDRPLTSHTNRSGGVGSKVGQSRPATGDGKLSGLRSLPPSRQGRGFSLEEVGPGETTTCVDIWHGAEEADADDVNLTVSHETALWSMNSLLKFMQNIDPIKIEEKAKKDAEEARRARLKMEARKRRSNVSQEKVQKEVYDVDKPEKDVDIESVQNVLFMLDQLEATTNPGSQMYGKSAQVLTKIGNERICRRNIAFPARGIPSLNFLIIETMKPYLAHPEKDAKLVAIETLAKLLRPGDASVSAILGDLAGAEDPEIKAAAIAGISAVATADDADDEEDKKNPLVRKMLTVTIKAASNLVAADASGTSDPFATCGLQAFDADIDEIKTMREQKFGAAKDLMKSNYEDTMNEAQSIVEQALKLMLLKRALILEVCVVMQIVCFASFLVSSVHICDACRVNIHLLH